MNHSTFLQLDTSTYFVANICQPVDHILYEIACTAYMLIIAIGTCTHSRGARMKSARSNSLPTLWKLLSDLTFGRLCYKGSSVFRDTPQLQIKEKEIKVVDHLDTMMFSLFFKKKND